MSFVRRAKMPALVFALSAAVYAAFLGDRLNAPSPDNHFVHLATSFLDGQLGVVGNRPPGTNDWSCYDTVEHGPCPINRYSFPESEAERYRWYVSFPPFPAVVIMPAAAIWGAALWDRLFWAIFGGLGPALLYVLLRHLRESERSARSVREDLVLTALFAFGTVYFYTAVQGTVWFAAHVVAVPLLALYALFSLGARRPVLAGLVLGLAFMTRATTAFLAVFFLMEAMAAARDANAPALDQAHGLARRVATWLRGVRYGELVRPLALFAAPILVIGGLAMWMNEARFEDPFEFGHQYLQIRWRPRIERWGLFNYHYLAKNLAVYLAALPWLTAAAPYVMVSGHGLALWFTTPNLLGTLWPKRVTATTVALFTSAGVVALLNLCYQNSGWIQFGYRFALDYMVMLFVLLAIGGRRFGGGFYLMMAFAIAVNVFGAITFDRAWQFYDRDTTQNVLYQPD